MLIFVILLSGSNILLKLNCHCSQSAIECTCDGMGGVTALLSDFDLVEEATSDDEWDRLGDTEPAGTRGMIAPEVNHSTLNSIYIVAIAKASQISYMFLL